MPAVALARGRSRTSSRPPTAIPAETPRAHQRGPAGPHERQGRGRTGRVTERTRRLVGRRGHFRRAARAGHPAAGGERGDHPLLPPPLTDQLGNQVTLFRVGGQGGFLDNVRLEGGTQGLEHPVRSGRTPFPWSREDLVRRPPGAKVGDVRTLWTLDYQRNGSGQGNEASGARPRFRSRTSRSSTRDEQTRDDNGKGKLSIAAGNPLRTHPKVNQPIESLKLLPVDALLDLSLFVPSEPGSTDSTIRLTAQGKPGINLLKNFIFDEGPTPPDPFTSVPHVTESRFAAVGDLLELTIFNDTSAHHPWHPHGILDAAGTDYRRRGADAPQLLLQ